MDLETRRNALVKMFLSFPAASKMDLAQVQLMTASYLEILQPISSETLSAACDAFRRKAMAFPPSSGELYDECLRLADATKKHADWLAQGAPQAKPARLPPPPRHGWSYEDLADFHLVINSNRNPYVMRVDAMGALLTIPRELPGAGQPVFYGYLTPAESAAIRGGRSSSPMSSVKLGSSTEEPADAWTKGPINTAPLPKMSSALRKACGLNDDGAERDVF